MKYGKVAELQGCDDIRLGTPCNPATLPLCRFAALPPCTRATLSWGIDELDRQVREMRVDEVGLMVSYFHDAELDFLHQMGVDPKRLPTYEDWVSSVTEDLPRPLEERQHYYLAWELDGYPVGHSNINKLIYGQEAFMHLHLWDPSKRRSGNGAYFVALSISFYFEKFKLQNLFCEPNAHNPGPNKTLPKIGFELVKSYETTPGWLNFHQPVNRWRLTREKWLETGPYPPLQS